MRPGWWALIGIVLAGLAGSGLWLIVTGMWPNPATELLAVGLLGVTLGGLTMPLAALLNQRFARPGWRKQDPRRLLREGVWVGLLGALYGWLQKEDALDWTIAAVIAGVFALMEVFFLTRDQA